jgi:hypothetical protein
MQFEATYSGVLQVVEEDPEKPVDRESVFDEAIDRISEELIALHVIEPLVSGSLTTGEIELTVTIVGSDPVSAFSQLDSTVRSAFHAAEVDTSTWPRVAIEAIRFSNFAATQADLASC